MLVVRNAVVGPFAANAYLVACTRTNDAVLVDPGGDMARVLGLREPGGWRISRIFCTHGHVDHVWGAAEARRITGAPLQIHAADVDWLTALPRQAETFGFERVESPHIDHLHEDGEPFELGECMGRVIHTPGHTPGSSCLFFPVPGLLFTGDTLFQASVGRTDLPGGDYDALHHSIRDKLFPLGDEVRFFPGHGPGGVLGDERRSNPFVGDGSPRGRFP